MADFEGRLSPGYLEEFDQDDVLDPRIQGELERLNRASEEINKLELELDDARAAFRQTLSDSTHKLDALAKKLGSCVDRARPYYDARMKAKEAHAETQKAAYMFERACSMHEAAKEMVQLAEQGYMKREEPSDPAWQEMLNHATMKVNEAEKERIESEQEHRRTTRALMEVEEHVQRLQKELKRHINKSRPYFEMKIKFNQMMEEQKRGVKHLEKEVLSTKSTYSDALRNLEAISDEIHQQRIEMRQKLQLGVRGAGVGSESPSPPPMRGSNMVSIDGTSTQHTSSCGSSNITTTTSSQSAAFSKTGQEFTPPSVIYTSPEKARSQSYRDAIEAGNEGGEDNPDIMQKLEDLNDSYEINIQEDYYSLPHEISPRGKTVAEKLNESFNSACAKRNSLSERVSPREDTSGSSKASPSERIPGSRLQEGTSSGETTPLSGSPSTHKKPKLKGLILGIDPLQVHMRSPTSEKFSRPTSEPEQRPASYPYSHNVSKLPPYSHHTDLVVKSRNTGENSNKTKELFVDVKSLPVDKQVKQHQGEVIKKTDSAESSDTTTLTVPSDLDEGSVSDTESITSGTMLDDDQVEMLTLDFSQQRLEDDTESKLSRNTWNRMSLPPTLNYLEHYLQKMDADDQTHKDKQEHLEDTEETKDLKKEGH